MVNFQKCYFFKKNYTFTINCVATGAQKKPIKYMFCFICSQQCIRIILSCKKCGWTCSVFKKIIPNNTIPTFQEVGGVTQPLIFCWWHKNLLYCVNHHKMIDFYSQGIFAFLFATVFNWNEPERQLIAKLILSMGRVIFPLFWFTKFLLVSIHRAYSVLNKITNKGQF